MVWPERERFPVVDREIGDTIQLTGSAGSSDVAVVKAIDYAANTLTLDRALTWAAAIGIAACGYALALPPSPRRGPRRILAEDRPGSVTDVATGG